MSFRDHFDGASLDARWTPLAAVNGAVTPSASESYVECNSPATGDVAAFYYNTKIDKTKSQLWIFTQSWHSGQAMRMYLLDKATAPVADTFVNIEASARLRVSQGSGNEFFLEYFDGTHTRQQWNGGTNAWAAPTVTAMASADDHYVTYALEIDGPNARWRYHAWGKIGSVSQDRGMVQHVLTDWILWSSMESTADLWLVLGWPINDTAAGGVARWEKIELQDGPRKAFLFNGQNTLGAGYTIRGGWGYEDVDGVASVVVPRDRTTTAIGPGTAGAWDDVEVKDPSPIIQDGSTYYTWYNGRGTKFQIGLASTTDPFEGTWTKHASNPVIPRNASAGERDQVFMARVVKDLAEPDSNKRWKALFSGNDAGAGFPQKTYYADALNPEGTWGNIVQAVSLTGTAGTFEENGHERPTPFWDGSQWVVFLGAKKADASVSVRMTYATGASLNNLTRSGVILLDVLDGSGEPITANITNSRTVSVADTSAFAKDDRVILDQDSSNANYTEAIVRKVVDGTTLELYEQITGFTTTAPAAEIRKESAWNRFVLSDIVQVGATFYAYTTTFDAFGDHATFDAYNECVGMASSASLTSGWARLRRTPVVAARNNFGFLRSWENAVTVHQPVHASAQSQVMFRGA